MEIDNILVVKSNPSNGNAVAIGLHVMLRFGSTSSPEARDPTMYVISSDIPYGFQSHSPKTGRCNSVWGSSLLIAVHKDGAAAVEWQNPESRGR